MKRQNPEHQHEQQQKKKEQSFGQVSLNKGKLDDKFTLAS